MLEQVAQAFDQKDYKTATNLLKQLWQEIPDSPLVQVYRARLYEVADKTDEAETIYRHLLRDVTNPKIAMQARQGLQRIQDSDKSQRKAAIAQAKTKIANSDEAGMLLLEAIPQEARQQAAQHMAKVMQLDAYTARMQIPNRGWKLYRTGKMGEIQFYGEQIRSGNLPAFWVTTEAIKKLPVYHVNYLQEADLNAVVVCENPDGQLGELQFAWTEVTQQVDGGLPIFENVVDTDILREGTRRLKKAETSDYVRVTDLHLPQRNCILRFCDRTYDFQSGIELIDENNLNQLNTRILWNRLINLFGELVPQMTVWQDFSPFMESALSSHFLVQQFDAGLHFYDQTDTLWASAFHLYSGLAYYRSM